MSIIILCWQHHCFLHLYRLFVEVTTMSWNNHLVMYYWKAIFQTKQMEWILPIVRKTCRLINEKQIWTLHTKIRQRHYVLAVSLLERFRWRHYRPRFPNCSECFDTHALWCLQIMTAICTFFLQLRIRNIRLRKKSSQHWLVPILLNFSKVLLFRFELSLYFRASARIIFKENDSEIETKKGFQQTWLGIEI